MLDYQYNNFYEIIQNNAKLSPKKPLLLLDKEKVSALELQNRVDSFARFLELSVGFGDRVALIVSNSVEFIVAFLAIGKIGAVPVPINTFLKHEEFAYILSDSKAKILICSSSFKSEVNGLFDETQVEKIIWSEPCECADSRYFCMNEVGIAGSVNATSQKLPNLDDLACIIYTSGTTGKPKGAMLTYKNMLSNMVAVNESFKIVQNDRFIVYLPMFHAFTLTVMVLLPLYANSSLVIVKSVFPFSNILKQTLLKKVTIFLGVPTVYNALLKAKIPWYFMWFNRVRIFVSGSAPLSESTLKAFKNKFSRAALLEGYGLSECSPVVSANRLELQKPLSVGPALYGYEVKIVDEEMVEVANGEVGEIIVRGDCVMKGYLGHPDITDETIINGWLKTGDLGKIDKDGYIYIVDRKKDLIISKGINIYPREIEEVIAKFEGVDAVAVIGEKNTLEDEDVIAFVQPVENHAIDTKILHAFLKEHLANFKLPKKITVVESLPRNATGKVLKRALKEHLTKTK